jgi:outer membrane receptor protein involved in Fe transport
MPSIRPRAHRRHLILGLGALALPPCAARAQTAPAAAAPEEITVIGASPLLGSGIDRDKVPANITVLDTADLARDGTPDVLHGLDTQVPGLSLDSAAGNPFQPTLFYNGFESSPLQGTSQGLAVYLNGVRFNQAFGDTVNWDLIPDLAIARVNVEGSNPTFGLNALGGSVNVRLKDGFSYTGAEADLSGGSFGQVQGEFQYGAKRGDAALYVAGSEEHQDGWRDLQSSDIQNFYADLGWRHDAAELHATVTLANSVLNGPGTAPIELLAVDPAGQFTAPNLIANKFAQFALSGTWRLDDTLSLQGSAYYSYFLQRVVNGNAPDDAPCDDGSGLLCSDPGTPSTTRGGAVIADFLDGGPYSELDDQTTNTGAYGAAAQVTEAADVLGRTNHLVAGVSFDGARTLFSATSFLGGLTPDTRVFIGPGVVIDEPGNNVPVRVGIDTAYAGVFASDTLDVTDRLSVTLSGRFNAAEVDLADENGGDLTGNHAYNHFNPAAGAAYRFAPWLTAYAGYSVANRAPTPAELSCAGPTDSCSLANFFVGDPDLKQVVAHTVEAGLRGAFPVMSAANVTYSAGLYHTVSDDDIAFVNSVNLNRAFFTNVGQTRRQGLDAHLGARMTGWSAYLNYAYTEASFRSGFVESAGSNPAADPNGNITINPGDRLPGIPVNKLTAGLDLNATAAWTVGGTAVLQSGQYLFGDEANLTPKLPGFFTVNLHTAYQITPNVQVFASVQNALDRRYYIYGTFSPTSSIFLAQAPNATNPRSYNLAAPIAGFGGVRLTF